MRFSETDLPGAFVVDVEEVRDHRGFFARAWCAREFESNGLSARLVQTNLSYNIRAGTLRGLHYQLPPHQEAKLVRCIRGAIHDVIVDLREESPTYRQWLGVDLTAENRRMLYVPEGFAHAFQTLEDDTEVLYQVSEFYTPGAERGIRFDDAVLGIRWPREVSVISEKDAGWPGLAH